MTRSAFDQASPQRTSGVEPMQTTREAAKRSVERVTDALEKVFAQAKQPGR